MGLYDLAVSELPAEWRERITVVTDVEELNRRVAAEFADLLEAKAQRNELLTVIAPVGPLNYALFVEEVSRRGLSCENLRTVNMDEYLNGNGELIPTSHPLSFRRFMDENFFSLLDPAKRPAPENTIFPDPRNPQRVTELIDEIGGADICWAGFGITGHVAFNDPPSMLGERDELDSFRNSKTRTLSISPMSTAQMLMGGTNGNRDVLPTRAITIGMYEILRSKKLHLTFMRNWHAGLWRRALLGPVSQCFPGSLVQEHPNVEITMTELAAKPPIINTSQATGEE
jgi:glucosamine-6-phosphate deaminase